MLVSRVESSKVELSGAGIYCCGVESSRGGKSGVVRVGGVEWNGVK